MKRLLIPLLVVADLALAGVLLSRWFTPNGQLRPVQWQPPAALPMKLDGTSSLPETGVELSRYVATLERPLFVPSRRPPPPPAPPKVAEVMPTVRVLAVYGTLEPAPAPSAAASAARAGPGSGVGLIARVDGNVRRLRVGDRIGAWTVEQVNRTEVVLAQGADRQHVAFRRGQVDDAADKAGAPAAATGAPGATGAPMANRAAVEAWRREATEQVRAMNARRARSGLPPLPEP